MNPAPKPPQLPTPGTEVADKYILEEQIGLGGMGAVFAARHRLTNKKFALKWMVPQLADNPESMKRFVREAQAACAIDHDNVVQVFDVGSENAAMYLVMEFLDGQPLSEWLARGRMAPRDYVDLLLPAMEGLAQAHAQGVVHRDIKPENIFLAERSGGRLVPKILDFGISKVGGVSAESSLRLTTAGTAMGTPYYMSPEQMRDAANVDHRSDIYAMGCVLYEGLAGSVPFHADSLTALVVMVSTEEPPHLAEAAPDVPKELADIVMECLSRDPAARPASMNELIARLRAALGIDQRLNVSAVSFLDRSPGFEDTVDAVERPAALDRALKESGQELSSDAPPARSMRPGSRSSDSIDSFGAHAETLMPESQRLGNLIPAGTAADAEPESAGFAAAPETPAEATSQGPSAKTPLLIAAVAIVSLAIGALVFGGGGDAEEPPAAEAPAAPAVTAETPEAPDALPAGRSPVIAAEEEAAAADHAEDAGDAAEATPARRRAARSTMRATAARPAMDADEASATAVAAAPTPAAPAAMAASAMAPATMSAPAMAAPMVSAPTRLRADEFAGSVDEF